MKSKEKAEAILMILKRIIFWLFLSFFIVISLFFLFIYISIPSHKADSQPKTITEINGILLDQSLSDFLFKNDGFKKEKLVEQDGKESEKLKAYSNERYFVVFVNQRVDEIHDSCKNLLVGEELVNGVGCNDSLDKIKSVYKDQLKIYCGPENIRVAIPNENKVTYILEKNKVKSIDVLNKTYIDKNWVDCKDFKIP